MSPVCLSFCPCPPSTLVRLGVRMTAKAGKAGADEAPANGSRAADSAARPLGNGAAGISSAAEPVLAELAEDLLCPICMSQLRDPFVTSCGHSFCHACVSKHLAHRNNCPSCAAYLTVDGIFPNFLLQKARHPVSALTSGFSCRRMALMPLASQLTRSRTPHAALV